MPLLTSKTWKGYKFNVPSELIESIISWPNRLLIAINRGPNLRRNFDLLKTTCWSRFHSLPSTDVDSTLHYIYYIIYTLHYIWWCQVRSHMTWNLLLCLFRNDWFSMNSIQFLLQKKSEFSRSQILHWNRNGWLLPKNARKIQLFNPENVKNERKKKAVHLWFAP